MLNILFPEICNGCNAMLSGNEKVLCISCRHELPLTRFHHTNNATLKELFQGKLPVDKATALLFFEKKSIVQELLHNLKYRRQEQISYFLGRWLGNELVDIDAYKDIDMVIPVPMHPIKKRKRGFNQVSGFGIEIANALKIPYTEKVLIKKAKTTSQVFKERVNRFHLSEIEKALYIVVNEEEIRNKHILLVDDIVTTGATLEQCGITLLKVPDVKLSIATMAITSS